MGLRLSNPTGASTANAKPEVVTMTTGATSIDASSNAVVATFPSTYVRSTPITITGEYPVIVVNNTSQILQVGGVEIDGESRDHLVHNGTNHISTNNA